MHRHIPSTRALLAFEAVARHHSVSQAAEELCITHSAVSQQIRHLEAQLGVLLFERSARGSRLTPAGRRYHGQVVGDLLRLQNHTLEAMAQRPDGTRLLVGCVPVFAERWLLPRLPDFLARHRHCSLHLQVFPTQTYMAELPFDLAVQYDDASWPGAQATPLMREVVVAVCAHGARHRFGAARVAHPYGRPAGPDDRRGAVVGCRAGGRVAGLLGQLGPLGLEPVPAVGVLLEQLALGDHSARENR